jgi:hypothetical protein
MRSAMSHVSVHFLQVLLVRCYRALAVSGRRDPGRWKPFPFSTCPVASGQLFQAALQTSVRKVCLCCIVSSPRAPLL